MLTSSYQKLDEQKEIKTLNIKENKYKYDKENEDSDTKPLLYMVEEIMDNSNHNRYENINNNNCNNNSKIEKINHSSPSTTTNTTTTTTTTNKNLNLNQEKINENITPNTERKQKSINPFSDDHDDLHIINNNSNNNNNNSNKNISTNNNSNNNQQQQQQQQQQQITSTDPRKSLHKSKSLNIDTTGHPIDPEHREFIDTSLASPTPIPPQKPPKPVKSTKKSTNPFDEEVQTNSTNFVTNSSKTNSNLVNSVIPLNPFNDDINQKKSSNPFDSDYIPPPPPPPSSSLSSNPSLQQSKSQLQSVTPNNTNNNNNNNNNQNQNQNSTKPTSTNPFDFEDNSTVNNQPNRSPNFIHSLSSPTSMASSSFSLKSPTSPKSRSSLTRFTEHSPEYPDLIQLLNLGFLPTYAYSSLMIHKEFNTTLVSLRNDLFTSLVQKTSPNWYPPILTRIGSWMPSQCNSSSRILYYIKVQLNHSDIAYVITKRYSEFVAFYKKLSPHLNKNSMYVITQPGSNGSNGTSGTNTNANGNGNTTLTTPSATTSTSVTQNVLIPFIDDRIRGYLLGTNEELCNRRQDMLHKWLSYLCLSERMMTDLQIHNLVVEFLQIEQYVKRIPILTGIIDKPVAIQIERTPREYL